MNENIDTVSAGMDERVAVHVNQTRKELEKNTQEVNQRSKTLIGEINDHKIQVDTAVEGIRQELGQTKEGLNRSVESIENEVRTVSAALQAEKQSTLSEFQKVNLPVSRIEAKITSGLATQTQSAVCTNPHHTSLVRAEGISQGKSNTTVSQQSHSKNSSNTIVSGVNTCNASGCNVSVNNVPDISCNGNVKCYLWQFLMAVLT
jgi:seryl-tRNA synthetase